MGVLPVVREHSSLGLVRIAGMNITPRDVMALSVSAHCSMPTARRYLEGKRMQPSIGQRLDMAAIELGGAVLEAAKAARGAPL